MGTSLSTRPVENPDELALFGDDWTSLGKPHSDRFRDACRQVAAENGGDVDPSKVRALLLEDDGILSIPARQYSALWGTACSRTGYLVKTDVRVPIVGEGSKGNRNKDCLLRRWVGEPL